MRTVSRKWRKSFMRKFINTLKERFERTVIMMAMLFAQRVILGKCEFEQVPKKLQKQVAEILVDECGMPELVPAEFGGTKDTVSE
mgnify:FL=1